jgi:DNA-binding NtrC family response regulator
MLYDGFKGQSLGQRAGPSGVVVAVKEATLREAMEPMPVPAPLQKLLVVEDDQSVRTTMVTCLELEGYDVDAVSTTREAIERLEGQSYPIVISDIYLDERTGIDVLRSARKQNPGCAVILMTGRGSMETVMAATEGGAFEYLAKPFEMAQMVDTIRRAEKSLAGPEEDEAEPVDDLPDTEMIGSSPRMIEIYKTISRVAPTDATVLIEGETGTGKELIAQMIHRNSRRAQQPFVPVDCGSIAPSLLESELFGTLRGAYTGADRDRMGVFEAAHNGTVFLDEIGDIELGFQLKLLRFLQEREVRPLGSPRAKKVDVRVIAATNRDMQKLVDEGKFREDLWYRLNVVRLTVPPLCERASDIPLLVHYFLKRYNERYRLDSRLAESGLKAMQEYSWPGNIRQLQHMMERLTILAPGGRIDDAAVKQSIELMDSRDSASETLADTEAEQIRRVLAATNGNKSRAAKILGIERKTLYRKLERMGL